MIIHYGHGEVMVMEDLLAFGEVKRGMLGVTVKEITHNFPCFYQQPQPPL